MQTPVFSISLQGANISVKINNKNFILCFCHRRSDRSFFFRGKQFPLCSRCTGILSGFFIGVVCTVLSVHYNFLSGIILVSPLVVDGTGQAVCLWNSTNLRRVITGILGGTAVWILFVSILSL
jgi:uncharacterized membrane protein